MLEQTSSELEAMGEYFRQKMAEPNASPFLPENTPFDVPPNHILYGKKNPYRVYKDNKGNIYVANPKDKLGKGAFGAVVQGVIIHAVDPRLKEGDPCAIKAQLFSADATHEAGISREVDFYYGDCTYGEGQEKKSVLILPYLPGINLSQLDSYDENSSSKKEKAGDKLTSAPGKQSSASVSDNPTLPASQGSVIYRTEPDQQYVPEDVGDPGAQGSTIYREPEGYVPEDVGDPGVQGSTVYRSPEGYVPEEVGNPLLEEVSSEEIVSSNTPPLEPEQIPEPLVFESVKVASDPAQFDIDTWLTRASNMAQEVKERAHDRGIIHCDLKPENFRENNEKITLYDFGFAERLSDKKKPDRKGTPHFAAPEVWDLKRVKPYTTKQDMYSLARTYELLMFKNINLLYANAYIKTSPATAVGIYKKDAHSSHLNQFQFENPANNPEIVAINSFLMLIHQLKSPNEQFRPEAGEVVKRLNEIQQQYSLAVAAKKSPEKVSEPHMQIKEILKAANLKGPKMAQLFQAKEAINAYNQKRQKAWATKPLGQKGVKPLDLVVPEQNVLVEILERIAQEKKAVILEPIVAKEEEPLPPLPHFPPQQPLPEPPKESRSDRKHKPKEEEKPPSTRRKARQPETDEQKEKRLEKEREKRRKVREREKQRPDTVARDRLQDQREKDRRRQDRGRVKPVPPTPPLPTPSAKVLQGLDAFIDKWSKVSTLQKDKNQLKSAEEVKAPAPVDKSKKEASHSKQMIFSEALEHKPRKEKGRLVDANDKPKSKPNPKPR